MDTRIDDVPTLHVTQSAVAAHQFNRVRVALRRLENPIRYPVPGLRSLDMLIGDEVWVCVDRNLNDLPVVAWTDFQRRRADLHRPVPCQIRYFHAFATAVVKRCLEETVVYLEQRLEPDAANTHRPVSSLTKRRA